MKTRNFLFIFVVLTIFTGCFKTSGQNDMESPYTPVLAKDWPIYDEASDIINVYAIDMAEKKGLEFCAAYVKQNMDTGRWTAWVDFTSMSLMDVCAGRNLLVHLVEDLLERFNYSHELQALIGSTPFERSDLYISVEFVSYFGKYIDPLYLGRMEFSEGYWSKFYAWTSFIKGKNIFHTHKEPYLRSLTIVQVQERELEFRKPKKTEEDLFIELTPSSFTNFPKALDPRVGIPI